MKFTSTALIVSCALPLAAWVGLQCPALTVESCRDHQNALKRESDRILAGMKVIQKDPKGFDQYQTPAGNYWIPAGDKVSYMLPFNLAEQAVHIYGAGDKGVRRGDVVLDCGANVGVFTRVALDAGANKIIAIEPAPENLECFRRNFAGEISAGKVVVVPKGVWNKEDVLTLHVDPTNSAADSFILEHKGEGAVAKVPLTTIDHLVAELKIDKVDFIKMDIEGAEPNALTGATQTLKKWKPRIAVSAYHVPDHVQRIPKIISGARPDYALECGPCNEVNGKARPDIMWFR